MTCIHVTTPSFLPVEIKNATMVHIKLCIYVQPTVSNRDGKSKIDADEKTNFSEKVLTTLRALKY